MAWEASSGSARATASSAIGLQPICDGFHSDYEGLFGSSEARPVALGEGVADPQHFSRHQDKRVHPDDLAWLEDR